MEVSAEPIVPESKTSLVAIILKLSAVPAFTIFTGLKLETEGPTGKSVEVLISLRCKYPVPSVTIKLEAVAPLIIAPLANIKLLELSVILPAVNVKVPLIIGVPLKVKPPALFNSIFLIDTPEMDWLLPVICIFPEPLWLPVPVILPPTIIVFPPSANVPEVKARLPLILLLKELGKETPLLLFIIKLCGPPELGNSAAVIV